MPYLIEWPDQHNGRSEKVNTLNEALAYVKRERLTVYTITETLLVRDFAQGTRDYRTSDWTREGLLHELDGTRENLNTALVLLETKRLQIESLQVEFAEAETALEDLKEAAKEFFDLVMTKAV